MVVVAMQPCEVVVVQSLCGPARLIIREKNTKDEKFKNVGKDKLELK